MSAVSVNTCHEFKSLEKDELVLPSGTLKPTLPSRGVRHNALLCSHMLNHLVVWAAGAKRIAY